MTRRQSITIRLTDEEHEWLRRCAHWNSTSVSQLIRNQLHLLIAETGYLRPPDDEAQDFGYEKEQMQLVVTIQESLK